MAKGDFLGEFEQIALLALARLDQQAYGMAIRQEIENRTGREIGIGSIYSALDRLERKGLVGSSLGEPTAERGGRAKRFYHLEGSGVRALEQAREIHERLWEGLKLQPGKRSR